MKKLSGLNWKQFFVNHFEKVLFGLVVLGGIVAVATSRWSAYDAKNPGELITKVSEAKEQHKISVWPEDEQKKYADVTDISAKAENLLAQLPVQEFAFSASLPGMFSPVIDNQQPIGDIDWLPVEQMIAEAGRVLISTTPKYDPSTMVPGEGLVEGQMPGGTMPGGQLPGQPGAQGEEERNPFAPRGSGGGMGMEGAYGPGGMPGMGMGAPGMAPGAPGGRNQPPGSAAPGAMPGEMEPGMEGMGMGLAMGVAQEGEGKRFVSVRGVFPLKRQEEVLAEALNLRTTAEATQHLTFLDYELQRQEAQPGPDTWSGPWKPVDVSIAMDTMKKSIGTEAVVFDQSTMSQVFTMPLPARLMGYWTKEIASHPALTAFSKTDLAAQQEQWLKQKLAEYKQQMKEFEETNVQQGGWADFQVSPMQIGMGMMDDPGAMRGLQTDFNRMFADSGDGRRGGGRMGQNDLKTQLQQLITASGAYLLFRYLDFDVEPGHAYRYRVRLKVANPAYGADLTQVERADIAEGATRWTEWSEPTPVSVVPKDSHHFLAAIDPGAKRQPIRAVFEMFQWMEDTGTMVNQNVTIPLGSAIGGRQETTVIDPAAQTAEPTNVDFESGDVLVDIDTGLNTGAGRTVQTASGATYEIPDRIVLANDWGGLEIGNKYAKAETRKELSEKYDLFTEAYKFLTEPKPEEGMLPGEEGMMLEEGMMPDEGRGGRRGRRGGGP